MNEEEGEAMHALDARLARLHRSLDTSPGFEDRLAARIATLRQARPAPQTAATLAGLEALHERERLEANRQVRIETTIVGIAAAGAGLAVWRFAPVIGRLVETYASTAEVAPALFAAGTLAAAVTALWAVLRRMGIEPRSLVGA